MPNSIDKSDDGDLVFKASMKEGFVPSYYNAHLANSFGGGSGGGYYNIDGKPRRPGYFNQKSRPTSYDTGFGVAVDFAGGH